MAIKRIFAAERPRPAGPGWDAVVALRARLREIEAAIDSAEESGVPSVLCAAQRAVVAKERACVQLLAVSLTKYSRVVASQQSTARIAGEQGAREAARATSFATPRDRQAFIESKTREIEARALDSFRLLVVDELKPQADSAAGAAVEALQAEARAFVAARLELVVPAPLADADQRQADAVERRVAGMSVGSRMQYARTLLDLARAQNDERLQRVTVAALQSRASDMLAGGLPAFARASALTPQQAGREFSAAAEFMATCEALHEQWMRPELLALAKEVQNRLLDVFRKTAGIDVSDPEVMTRARRQARGWKPCDLDVLGGATGADWLTRFYGRRQPLMLQPWTSFSPSPLKLDEPA